MSKVKVILDGEEIKGSWDDSYRREINVNVEEDSENEEQLCFSVNDKQFFIRKEDLNTLIHVFKI